MNLRSFALRVLQEPDRFTKLALLNMAQTQKLAWVCDATAVLEPLPHQPLPGLPKQPILVSPNQVPMRSAQSRKGLATLLHAIVHIEFNAIHLALDAVWRFAGLPDDFYTDWMTIALEEAEHFTMLNALLEDMGYQYGDFAAHDGLWQMCVKTQHDVLARMALVPRTLEARGLDATPVIQAKLQQTTLAEAKTAHRLLDRILADEKGHVQVGNRWYHYLCEIRQVDPLVQFQTLFREYQAPWPKPPLNEEARLAAGFSQAELNFLMFH